MATKTRKAVYVLVLGICWTLPGHAEDSGYWSIELPVPESATNVVTTADRQFLVKSVSFDWEGKDTADLREFYAKYFETVDWENPMANSPRFPEFGGSGWASYAMDFDAQNKPVAKYGTMWKAKQYPALGAITVQLNEFDNGKFKGSAVVKVGPEVDTQAMFRLSGLLGDDPKNLFKLHAAVNGNPFELHTIALPANYREESDPLLAEYYQIVDEIILEYRNWEREYILD